MSRKGPEVGKGKLDFVEVVFVGVKSHYCLFYLALRFGHIIK